MTKANEGAENQNPTAPKTTEKSTEKTTRVRVICEGVLGPLGLVKGNTTNDPEYVALLKTKRGKTLVEEVK